MADRNEISVELSAISALVGGIGRQTPYRAPVGYFDRFPAAAMDRIYRSSSIVPGSSIIPGSSIVPDSPIPPTQSPAFQVPDGYFDGLAAQVLARIKAGASTANVGQDKVSSVEDELPPIFNRISRITPYQVPEGYWKELSPLLAVARDKAAYAVPEGYFAALAGQILEKAGEPVGAKVIPMERASTGKVLKGNWWKYSSVASIAACLLLIFSWPQVENKASEGNVTAMISQGLQKVPDQEMQTYLEDQQHSLLADPLDNSTATLDMNEGEVKSFLGDVSDNDLQQYMEEHEKADDLATN